MNLYLPSETVTDDSISTMNPRQLKRWINDLPLINMGETTRQFYQALQSYNRQNCTARQRFETMERLLPTADMVTKYLSKNFINCAFPLAKKTQQIERLTHSLYQELSVGYKLIVNDVSSGAQKLDNKMLATAIYRSMWPLYRSFLLDAQTYTDLPGRVWHDLHQLYEFAEAKGLNKLEVPSSQEEQENKSSINNMFIRCCLLGLADSNRLRNGEALKLHNFLNTAAEMVSITKSLNADKKGLLHVVSLKTAGPPIHIKLAEMTTFSNLRGLNMDPLIDFLKQHIGEDSDKLPEITKSLARRLFHAWTCRDKRKFSRISSNARIITSIGVQDILHAISVDKFPGLTVEEILQKLKDDAAAATAPGLSLSTTQFNLKPKRDTWYKTTVSDPRFPESWHQWDIVNTSAGGYGLIWKNTSQSRAQVGDIISLREKEGGRHLWRMGQIRWLRHTEEDDLMVGVKLLAPRTVIATVENVISRKRHPETPFEAIMLPGMKTFKQPPSIIAPQGYLEIGDKLTISMLGKQLEITLKSIGEDPNFFTQFFYKSTDLINKTNDKAEFDNLWERL